MQKPQPHTSLLSSILDNSLVFVLQLLSFLPLSFLYLLSSILSGLLFSVFHYKRPLLTNNLTRAFPHLNNQAIQHLARQTYQHHLDILAELIKTLRMNQAKLQERVTIKNPELLANLLNNNQPVLLVTSHFGNWEWLQLACAARYTRPPAVVYKRISHPAFDKLLIKLRTRFGSELIATDQIVTELQKRRQTSAWIAMAADLAPRPEEKRYWATFMGIETAFYSGIPRVARITHATIFYGHMQRTARGHYQLTFERLSAKEDTLSEDRIMAHYISALEHDIQQAPSNWIWFYKRWKHEKPKL
ncbi:MAG: lysophospholipid acyltransferase family protein [Gammaproteobacteria bacterium]